MRCLSLPHLALFLACLSAAACVAELSERARMDQAIDACDAAYPIDDPQNMVCRFNAASPHPAKPGRKP